MKPLGFARGVATTLVAIGCSCPAIALADSSEFRARLTAYTGCARAAFHDALASSDHVTARARALRVCQTERSRVAAIVPAKTLAEIDQKVDQAMARDAAEVMAAD
jgi:hypothetical protein